MDDVSARPPCPRDTGSPVEAQSPSRRGFLGTLLGVFLAATGATFIGPVLAYLSPRKTQGGRNILMDKYGSPVTLDQLQGQPFFVGFGIEDEPTIVMRYAGELRAFTASCSHLGCSVKWLPASAEFLCPCHGGRFDANGVNIAGPPPKPLRRYKVYATGDGHIGLEVMPS